MMHINGVTELNSIDVYTTPWWLAITLFISIVLLVICAITMANIQKPSRSLVLVLGISAIILVVVVGALGISCSFGVFDEYSYTKYEVIVDDTVNVNDFNNTYKTIEQRGDIYVVRFLED